MVEAKSAAKPKNLGNDPEHFLDNNDQKRIVPKKISDGLTKLGGNYLPEMEFMRLIGVGSAPIAKFREQFKDHWIELGGRNPKRYWFGDRRVADRMREELA